MMLLVASTAEGQAVGFTGMLTGHIGGVAHADVQDWSLTPGVAMAVLDLRGLGAEVDFGYSSDFENDDIADGSIGTLMVNFMAMRSNATLRPFVVAGAGLIQTRAENFDERGSTTQTNGGWNAGAGIHYSLSDALGFRGDVRYFRNFSRDSDLPIDGVFDFVRYSVGVTFSWPIK
jgi:opacity protein-like surface antigen